MKVITIALSALLCFNAPAFATGASGNASTASEHSVLAVGHATASGSQVASAVIAVPLIAVGSVGSVAMAAGQGLMDSATAEKAAVDQNQSLEISEVTITVQRSPAEQMAKTNHR